ncbi:hypothetical protein Tlie_0018 [Thermovirga lienii DSM 17291]|jgi:uncharacterized membrane protein YraQ (UPF0718 family)|uniref:Permease n=1 Tax=Thermovirga lienii (strain ATCC BAA-1197 / DSM 17291 / Cas60314) TaxID=580340 RepID=G7V5D7_THELD|nr:permease [Thermovirga lienii]AER65764.1 hypothetical protein Tlie_0018 [Thermovirga lienii DSM 17291]MDN5319458.1 hypothetical protein [Thermovirga sp.]MDN5368336.1 hypothetical protein [Thermovirga sp.]
MKVVSVKTLGLVLYVAFLVISLFVGFEPGREMSHTFLAFLVNMLKILPFAFVLIGLFEVWVKKETVERHLGRKSGLLGYVWAILLAGSTVGGLYVAFPVAHSLYSKGAKLGVVFTYVGASAICRVPMTIYEASFMGIKFTAIRFLVSLPLLVLFSMALEAYLERKNYRM